MQSDASKLKGRYMHELEVLRETAHPAVQYPYFENSQSSDRRGSNTVEEIVPDRFANPKISREGVRSPLIMGVQLSSWPCLSWSLDCRGIAMAIRADDLEEKLAAMVAPAAAVMRLDWIPTNELSGIASYVGRYFRGSHSLQGRKFKRYFATYERGDDPLAHRSGKTRKKIRYAERRLGIDVGAIEFRRFERDEDVDSFCEIGEFICGQGYHGKKGIGIRNSPDWRDLLSKLALAGRLRGEVLFCGADPVAYLFAVVHEGGYSLETIGVNRSIRAASAGTVLLSSSLRRAIVDESLVVADFGTGQSEYKDLFTTICVEFGSVHCYARKVSLPAVTQSLLESVSKKISILSSSKVGRRLRRQMVKRSS
jgi:hypothetical protein